jgi:glycosyltransferase involved in cell wall biosynthesis
MLERAIKSVLLQKYQNYEHIVVDGGSTDGTLDLLRRYPHIIWISEPDHGQSDAMNKGFTLSTGDIVVMLNCDDHFAPGAFNSVVPLFEQGAKFVAGNVEVKSYRLGNSFINVPRIDLRYMMRHWEYNAYCYNPVGYFYTREVQTACPFNISNQNTMDLEFILCAGSKFPITKIDNLLGYYDEGATSKTTRTQGRPNYWTVENFPYVELHIDSLPDVEQKWFRIARQRGYRKAERYWRRKEIFLRLRKAYTSIFKKPTGT